MHKVFPIMQYNPLVAYLVNPPVCTFLEVRVLFSPRYEYIDL